MTGGEARAVSDGPSRTTPHAWGRAGPVQGWRQRVPAGSIQLPEDGDPADLVMSQQLHIRRIVNVTKRTAHALLASSSKPFSLHHFGLFGIRSPRENQ